MFLYLTETLRSLWEDKLGKKVALYCQNCGEELTKKGGDVSASGGVYCDNRIECVVARMNDSSESITTNKISIGLSVKYLFLNPKRLQKLISKGKITKYGPLEKAVSNT